MKNIFEKSTPKTEPKVRFIASRKVAARESDGWKKVKEKGQFITRGPIDAPTDYLMTRAD